VQATIQFPASRRIRYLANRQDGPQMTYGAAFAITP
jgi:hypothetical protein